MVFRRSCRRATVAAEPCAVLTAARGIQGHSLLSAGAALR